VNMLFLSVSNQRESLDLCISLSLVDSGLVNTFPQQQAIVLGMIFYVVCVMGKEIRAVRYLRTFGVRLEFDF
jgi:hypothetical protein